MNEPTVFLDYEDLKARGIKFSRRQLLRKWSAGRFPRPVKLGGFSNAWIASEIDEWIKAQIAERDAPQAA